MSFDNANQLFWTGRKQHWVKIISFFYVKKNYFFVHAFANDFQKALVGDLVFWKLSYLLLCFIILAISFYQYPTQSLRRGLQEAQGASSHWFFQELEAWALRQRGLPQTSYSEIRLKVLVAYLKDKNILFVRKNYPPIKFEFLGYKRWARFWINDRWLENYVPLVCARFYSTNHAGRKPTF